MFSSSRGQFGMVRKNCLEVTERGEQNKTYWIDSNGKPLPPPVGEIIWKRNSDGTLERKIVGVEFPEGFRVTAVLEDSIVRVRDPEHGDCFYTRQGELLIPPSASDFTYLLEQRFLRIYFIGEVAHYELTDLKGRHIADLPPDLRFEKFSDGLLRVSNYQSKETGYINRQGQFQVKLFRTDFAKDFHDGLAVVSTNLNEEYESRVIDRQGKTIFSQKNTYIEDFQNGVALITTSQGNGLINRAGQVVIPPTVGYLYQSGDQIVCLRNDHYEILDMSGKVLTVLPKSVTFIQGSGDRAERLWNFGTGGTLYGKKSPSDGQPFVANYTSATKYGAMDKSGKVVIKPTYDQTYPFDDGLAPVAKLDKKTKTLLWGVINERGKLIVPLKYKIASVDRGSIFLRLDDGKWDPAHWRRGEGFFNRAREWVHFLEVTNVIGMSKVELLRLLPEPDATPVRHAGFGEGPSELSYTMNNAETCGMAIRPRLDFVFDDSKSVKAWRVYGQNDWQSSNVHYISTEHGNQLGPKQAKSISRFEPPLVNHRIQM